MKLRNLFPIIGLLLFAYIIYNIGIDELYHNLLLVNPIYIVINIILVFVSFLLPTYKWILILKYQNVAVSFKNLLKIFLISTFYGNVTPGRAGSWIRVYYLKDVIKRPLGFCSSSIFIDRMMDLLTLLLFAIGGIFLISKDYYWLLWPLILIFIVSISSSIFLFDKKRNLFVLKFIYKYFVPKRFKTLVKENYLSFYENVPSFKKLLYPFILSIISWMVFYSLPYVFFVALGIKLNYIYYVFLYALSTLITLLPISVAGIGTREASLIVLFGFYGVTAADVVVISFLSFVIFIGITSIIGWYLSLKWRVEHKDGVPS